MGTKLNASVQLNDGMTPIVRRMATVTRSVVQEFEKLQSASGKPMNTSVFHAAEAELKGLEAQLDDVIAKEARAASGGKAGGGGSSFLTGFASGLGKVGGVVTMLNQGLQLVTSTAQSALAPLQSVIDAGMSRAGAIEGAEATLSGLHHSASEISSIMDDAKQSVLGTAFGLGDAGKVAASAVAAGVQPGQDLQRTLGLVADAASVTNTDMSEMGAIFNKVAAGGKLQGEELNQLTDKGIPMLSLLADSMGTTTAEVRDMVSAGKIGFPELQNAIESGMGGAAKQVKTFEAGLANTQAAIGRLGAAVMTPLRDVAKDAFNQIIPAIDSLTGKIQPVFEQIGESLSPIITRLLNELLPLLDRIAPIIENIGTFWVETFDRVSVVIEPIASMMLDLFQMLTDGLSTINDNASAFVQFGKAVAVVFGGAILAAYDIIQGLVVAFYGMAGVVWTVIYVYDVLAMTGWSVISTLRGIAGDVDGANEAFNRSVKYAQDAGTALDETKKSFAAAGDAATQLGENTVQMAQRIGDAMNSIDGLESTIQVKINANYGNKQNSASGDYGSKPAGTGWKWDPQTQQWYGGKLPAAKESGTSSAGSTAAQQTAKNTKQTAINTAQTKEDLKYLRDVATRKAVNRFTTANLNLNFTANNNVASGKDVDGITTDLFGKIVDGLNAVGAA
jgi:tape measure domain-containing protein